ncbi:MAG: substrate-binding domain-containing protein, partial [Bryobacteraceae bacterium]
RPGMKAEAGARYQIESVVRACRILSAFRSEEEALRLQDLADRAALTPSTTLRLVRTLEQCGFLTRVADGRYRSVVKRSGTRYRVGYAVDSAGKLFRQEVTVGLQYAAARREIELLCLDHPPDRRLALRDADSLIGMGVNLVIDFQTGYDLAGLVAQKYLQAGIPMIAIDTPHPGATFFGVNNYVAGRDGGRWLGEWVRRHWRGRIDRVVHCSAGQGAVTTSRVRGALAGLGEIQGAGPKFLVEELEATGNVESTFHSVQRWLSKGGGGRTLFIMATDPAVIGALTALEEAGGKIDAAVFGFGGNQETRMALREPSSRLIGCVGFHPECYGDGLLRTAISILENKPTPPAVFVDHSVITAENADLLYPHDRMAAIAPRAPLAI